MSTPNTPKNFSYNCFKNIHPMKYNNKDESFHEILENEIENVLNLYKNNEDFNDIVPLIQKKGRANFLYKRLVYKGFKWNSPFMRALAKAIKKLEQKDKLSLAKRKFEGIYKLPSLEILKMKKEKIDKIKNMKLKELKIKSENPNSSKYLLRSLSNFNLFNKTKTPKMNNNFNLNESNYSFNNNNFSTTNRFSKISHKSINKKELSTYYISDTNFANSSLNTYNLSTPKINKANYIISKCREEIDSGNEVSENVCKMDKTITNEIRKKYQTIGLMQKSQTLNLDTIGLKKYKKMEVNNLNEIKRKLNERISDTFAYKTRKEINENIKNAESINAYYIYLHDMDKTNDQLEEKRIKSRKIINRVESLCEDEFNKKEYLKNLIDIYNKRHKNFDKLQKIKARNLKNDLNWIEKNNKEEDDEDDDENDNIYNPRKGNYFPKLMSLREKSLKDITIGEFLFKKNKK